MSIRKMSVAELERWLAALVGERSGLSPEEVEVDRALVDYGVSSRDAVELAGRLEELLERAVPDTLLWEHPTIERIAAALLSDEECAPATPATHTPEREPVAVVGLGCRLPGAVAGPEDFWRLLERGGDAVGAVPAQRWSAVESAADAEVLERTTRAGGFLGDIAGFDAAFFAISPREAARMDPQQRMVLEVGWEALEHAGISPDSLRGSRTGVFVGVSAGEYGQRSLSELASVDAWSGTGGALSVTANRLSYALDLRGPSVAVDTACSSSLVAVHLGMQSLMTGESDLVVAAGTNLLLGPAVTAAFHEMGVISQSGRCRPFSADADGIVRAEGAGVVVLKRLSDAVAHGDRIFAVLPGSATNQDGHSNGITAPAVEAQEELLRLAYGAAQVDPGDVDYVEAHGTGTLLGDPIEARALSTVLGAGRPADRPLLIGSAKSNLGHLEAAAGIVGLIKLVLSIGRRRIPANLHYKDGHPHIDFNALGLSVVDRASDWPVAGRPARAGVSAFGFGGTNAHVVVEEPPASPLADTPAENDRIGRFLLAGPDLSRIRDQAEELADWLEGPGRTARLLDVEHTLGRRLSGRARAGVVARDRAALISGLRACAEGGRAPNLVEAGAERLDAPPVWVFSGQGSQWAGMGMGLMRDEPAFADAMRELDGLIAREAGFSVCEELERGEELTAMERLQPVLFAVQVALSRLLRAHGHEPAAIVGQSLGEVAAAVACGGLSAADGARVVTLRSRLLATLTGTGAMALLELSPDEVTPMLRDYPAVELAAFNAPTQVTVAGAPEQIAELVAAVERRGRLAKQIKSVVAGHCRLVDPVVDALAEGLRGLVPREPHTPVYSTVLENPRAVPAFDAEYWAANIRRPVRFAQAVGAAAVDGHASFLEISPHPLLSHALADSVRAGGLEHPVLITTGRRCEDETAHVHAQLTALLLHGRARPVVAPNGGRVIDLPRTRWRHVRHWLEPATRRAPAAAHPLLGDRIELPGISRPTWQAELDPVDPDTAGTDRFVALTTWLEIAHAAATDVLRPDQEIVLRDLVLHEPRALGDRCTLTTSIDLDSPHTGRFTVHSRIGRGAWRLHVSAKVETRAEGAAAAPPAELDGAIQVVLAPPQPAERGSRPAVQVVEQAVHALVDSLGLAGQDAWLAQSVGEVRWRGDLAGIVLARIVSGVSVVAGSPEVTTTLQLTDDEGRVRLQLDALTLRGVRAAELPMALPDKLLKVEWQAVKAPRVPVVHGRWLVVGDESDARAGALAEGLRSRGAEARVVCGAEAEETLRAEHAVDGVVNLVAPAPAQEDAEVAPLRGAALVLAGTALARALSERPAGSDIRTRLYFATSGAAPIDDGDQLDPAQAALRGLVRVLAFEHPELQPTWVDLDQGGGIDDLLNELGSTDAEDEVAWRDGRRHVARLVRLTANELRIEGARTVRADGAYLITGGLGGLGLVLARWLAESGAAKVVLNGRSAPAPAAEQALAALRELGTEVVIVRGDIADPGVAEQAVAACVAPGARVRGVIHAAAAFEDRVALQLDAESLQRVWSAKAVGASRLSAATAGLELDWWVGFSSAAALIGSPGQAAYAAANAYLDALTAWRRAQGMVASTINWGTWSQVGGAAQRTADAVSPITPAEGVEALEALLAARIPAAGVLRLDPAALVESFPDLAEIPLLSRIVSCAERSGKHAGSAWPGVAALDPHEAPARIRERVDERVAAVLGSDSGRLDADAPLTTLGLDSLLAMRIRNAVQHDFDRLLPPSLMLRGASINDVVTWLCEALDLAEPSPAAERPRVRGRARVAPRDASERLVAAAWEEVLGRSDLGVTDRLDAQDGDLAAAIGVGELLSLRTGRRVSVEDLLVHPTIERQAALVREPESASRSPLRLLHEGDATASLFMFHPGGGNTLVYRQLVEQLDPRLTVWGLDRLTGVFTVEHRAERYVELLRQTQPTGPYLLAGWSFGGALAYETARRLQSAGERVDLLAMIDTILPLPDPPEMSDVQVLERRFQRFAGFLEDNYGKRVTLPYERMARLDDDAQTDVLIESILAAGLIDPVAGAAILEHQRTSYLDVRALDRYRPGRVDGRVVLYSAREVQTDGMRDPRFDRRDPARGWDAVCGEQLDVVPIPGHHLSVLDPPHVDTLASHLNQLLPALVRAAA